MRRTSTLRATAFALFWSTAGSAVALDPQFQACSGIGLTNACGVKFPPIPEKVCLSPGSHPIASSYQELDPACDYGGVQFSISQSNVTLDCKNALLYAQDHTSGPAIDIISKDSIRNITIRNCFIAGFDRGIEIHRDYADDRPGDLYRIYSNPTETAEWKYLNLTAIDDRIREQAPQEIRLENVHIACTEREGIYIFNYVTRVSMDGVSINNTRQGPGIYLDSGSRHNELRNSCIAGSAREGLAIDSSAFNVIARNRFERNGNGGVMLYKNAGECSLDTSGACHGKRRMPRTQHSEGNLIEDNVFSKEIKAVWVASRAARDYYGSDLTHGDPVILEHIPRPGDLLDQTAYRYYRDYAERTTIRRNAFRDTIADAVVIEDDHTLVADNVFNGGSSGYGDVYLGSRVRERVGDPVYATEVRGNKFLRDARNVGRLAIKQEYCTTGSIIDGNIVFTYDEPRRVDHREAPCETEPIRQRYLHPALIGASIF
jgi:hypothetical protein